MYWIGSLPETGGCSPDMACKFRSPPDVWLPSLSQNLSVEEIARKIDFVWLLLPFIILKKRFRRPLRALRASTRPG